MTDYSKMSDAEINTEVAKLQFPTSERNTPYYHRPDVYIYHRNGTHEAKDYCNSWADAGPIIEQSNISLTCHQSRDEWAAIFNRNCMAAHSNPLRAAMITFLMMQEKP